MVKQRSEPVYARGTIRATYHAFQGIVPGVAYLASEPGYGTQKVGPQSAFDLAQPKKDVPDGFLERYDDL